MEFPPHPEHTLSLQVKDAQPGVHWSVGSVGYAQTLLRLVPDDEQYINWSSDLSLHN